MDKERLDSESDAEAMKLIASAKAAGKRRKRRRLIIFIALIVMMIMLYIALRIILLDGEDAPAAAQDMILEAVVTENVYTQTIDLSGYVEPYDTQETKFRSTGAVTGVYVKEGDKVKEGQLLASIDNTAQLADLQSIRDSIEEAELRGSARELELLKLQEINAENALEYTNIVANFDGEVASVDVEVNDYFEAGDSVMTIVDRSRLKATVEIDEIDMQYVEIGEIAELTFDSIPGEVIEAEVTYIPMLGRYTDQGIGVADVELTIENPPEGLMPGFTFDGVINVEGEVSMILIPQAAVTVGRGGAASVERKRADGTTETVSVRVKYLGEGLCQVLSSDLVPGDVLVYTARSGSNAPPMMRMF